MEYGKRHACFGGREYHDTMDDTVREWDFYIGEYGINY